MKFYQVSVGQKFLFEGERFVKISPLLASSLEGGKQKLIRRAAIVDVTEEISETKTHESEKMLPLSHVLSEFDRFYSNCENVLEQTETEIGKEKLEEFRLLLEQYRQECVERLQT